MNTSQSLAMLRLFSALGRPDPDSPSDWGDPPPGWHRPWPPWIIYASTPEPIPPAPVYDYAGDLSVTSIPALARSAMLRKATAQVDNSWSPVMSTPDPIPPRMVIDMISAASALSAIGAELPDMELRRSLCAGADTFINQLIDDYCGTPPGKPRPPKGSWSTIATAVNIYNFAEGLSEGTLQARLFEAAGRMLANAMQEVETIE